MQRRDFIGNSLKAAALLSPLASIRTAEAAPGTKRVVFWVCSSGYPVNEDFFPTSGFELRPILSGLAGLEDQMTIIDGVSLNSTGPNPKGNNHVRTPGLVLTAKNVIQHPSDAHDGLAGGISIDQLIKRELGLKSLELHVDDRARSHMRARPFATGPRSFVTPIQMADDAFRRVFDGEQPATGEAEAQARAAARARLLRRRSMLDGAVRDIARVRPRLSALEREKLEAHEDALRRAEMSVADELELIASGPAPTPTACAIPDRPNGGGDVPTRARAHLDVMVAALACNRIRVGGMVWSHSGYKWSYRWVTGVSYTGNIHDHVQHRASQERENFVLSSAWDWTQLGEFVRRLQAIPEGSGTMLDHTMVVGVSHFGRHHRFARIPIVIFGGQAGGMRQGRRVIRVPEGTENDKVLTSVGRWMGVEMSGIGNDPNCGPLDGFLG